MKLWSGLSTFRVSSIGNPSTFVIRTVSLVHAQPLRLLFLHFCFSYCLISSPISLFRQINFRRGASRPLQALSVLRQPPWRAGREGTRAHRRGWGRGGPVPDPQQSISVRHCMPQVGRLSVHSLFFVCSTVYSGPGQFLFRLTTADLRRASEHWEHLGPSVHFTAFASECSFLPLYLRDF